MMEHLIGRLGKEAGQLAARTATSRSGSARADAPGSVASLFRAADGREGSSQAPTRYGRKPYSRGMKRDST